MKKIIYLLTFSILLLGCSSKQIPDWRNASFNQLENFKQSYLSGKENIAELHFNRAVDEIKKSGDLDMLARVYLTKYALHVTALETFDDTEYRRIDALQSGSQNRNFYSFLKGSFDTVDEKLLPSQYGGFLRAYRKGKAEDIADEISKIEDPLSKLITIGLLVQKNKYDEGNLKVAIDTASNNGWKKVLLVYLDKLQSFYEIQKEKEKAANIRQKILLIKK
jgi:hypothetical protein